MFNSSFNNLDYIFFDNNDDILIPIKAYLISICIISLLNTFLLKIKFFKYFPNSDSNLNDVVKYSLQYLYLTQCFY